MAFVLADRVRESTTTTGTGAVTLAGAATGYQTFADGIGSTNTTYYAIAHQTASEWEVGLGTVGSGTLTRTTVLKSSNSDSAVDFASGTKDVFVTYPAEKAVTLTDTQTLTNKTIDASQLTGTVANARLDAQLQDVAGLGVTDGNFIVGNGSNFVAESGSTARTSLGLGSSSTQDTGISNNNVPKFTSGVADDDFLRVDGTAIEGRSASEVLSDIGAQASDAQLTDIAGLAVSDGNFIVGDGSNWVAESGATARTSLGLGSAATQDTGISNNNVPKFTSGAADNDFLRIDGTAIEGRSASEVLSDIGAQASDAQLTDIAGLAVSDGNFIVGDGSNWVAESGATARTSLGLGSAATQDTGISNNNVPKFTSGVADDDFLRVAGTTIEGRSASEVLGDIGGQGVLTTDGASLPWGVHSEITLAHVHDTGLTLTNTVADTDNRPVVLNLKSEEDAIVADDVIGSLRFTGGDSGGTDAVLTAASIDAVATDTHASDNNATKLSFKTGASEAATEKMTISAVGDVNMKNTATGDDTPMTLTLQTGETDIAADDKLGVINFQAPDEGTGTDAVLVAAGLEAVSEGDFSSSSNATSLIFKTGSSEAATEKVRITSNGNLLANATAASAASVVHELRTPTAYDDGKWAVKVVGTSANTDGTGPYGLWINYPNATPDNNSTNDFFFASDATAARFMIISSGDFWTADGGWVDSDETLKENITDATAKLADVERLRVRNFNWRESHHPSMSDKKLIGFVAQEIEQVFPGLVQSHDINPQGKDGTTNMKKGVKASALVPILTKAIQELSAKVTALEARVDTLEG